MTLKQWYKIYQRKKMMNDIAPYVELSSDSHYGTGFSVDLRHPVQGKKYLKIGTNCMIDGRFIFETEDGYIEIGDRCHIGGGQLISRSNIKIGNDVTIAWGFTIYDHNSHSVDWEERKNDTIKEYQDVLKYGDPIRNKDWLHVTTKPIIINDKTWIGLNTIILKGVTIGEGAVVAAGSVVIKNVDPWTIVGGNPAKEIKKLKNTGEQK